MANTAPNPLRQGPENYSDLGDVLATVMGVLSRQIENMLPCRVISYDRAANTAIVQPLMRVILTGGEQPRAQIGPIPVFAAGGGNYVFNFPLKAGDLGWMLANDRDISAFVESLDESAPATFRTHSFNDAVLFPDPIRNFDTTGQDGSVVLQSMDGAQRIAMGDNQITLTHPAGVTIDALGATVNAPLQADTLTASNGITGTFVDGNGKILNFVGGTLVGAV